MMTSDESSDTFYQDPPDCGMCGAEEDGIHGVPIQVTGGDVVDVDLCDDCLEEVQNEGGTQR